MLCSLGEGGDGGGGGGDGRGVLGLRLLITNKDVEKNRLHVSDSYLFLPYFVTI